MIGPKRFRKELMNRKFCWGLIDSERVVKSRMSRKNTVICISEKSPRSISVMLFFPKNPSTSLGMKRSSEVLIFCMA